MTTPRDSSIVETAWWKPFNDFLWKEWREINAKETNEAMEVDEVDEVSIGDVVDTAFEQAEEGTSGDIAWCGCRERAPCIA